MTVTDSATFWGNSVFGVLRCTRSVCLSGVSIPSISWNVNACTPSLAYCSYQYLTSAAVSSRPFRGGTLCHFTPCRILNVHTRESELDCHDSARSGLSVTSSVLFVSSGKEYRIKRALVSPTNWNNPIDCVSRGSITGGRRAAARARTRPRLGGLGLAGIQSGYLEAAAARRPVPSTAVAETPAAETRMKSRRFRRASGACIVSSSTVRRIEGRDGPDT